MWQSDFERFNVKFFSNYPKKLKVKAFGCMIFLWIRVNDIILQTIYCKKV